MSIELTGIKDIDNIIYDYKQSIEDFEKHKNKYVKVMKELENTETILNEKHRIVNGKSIDIKKLLYNYNIRIHRKKVNGVKGLGIFRDVIVKRSNTILGLKDGKVKIVSREELERLRLEKVAELCCVSEERVKKVLQRKQ